MGALIRTVAPATEPVTLAEAKAHLRVDHSAEDAYITALALAAREEVEARTARALIAQTWRWELDAFPCRRYLLVPIAPLLAVSEIRYVAADGTEAVMPGADYIVDAGDDPGRIVLADGAAWPSSIGLLPARGVRITLNAGYGATAAAVPERLKLALKMLTSTWYENRETVSRDDLKVVPGGLDALLAPFKAWNAGGHARVSQEGA